MQCLISRVRHLDGRIVEVTEDHVTVLWSSMCPEDVPVLCVQAVKCALKMVMRSACRSVTIYQHD